MVMLCSKRDPLSHFKRLQMGLFGFHRRLEPCVLPWQQHRGHSVYFVMYISGAKSEELCSNISGDTLDSVFRCLCETFMASSLSSYA